MFIYINKPLFLTMVALLCNACLDSEDSSPENTKTSSESVFETADEVILKPNKVQPLDSDPVVDVTDEETADDLSEDSGAVIQRLDQVITDIDETILQTHANELGHEMPSAQALEAEKTAAQERFDQTQQ